MTVLERVEARCAEVEEAMRALRFGTSGSPLVIPPYGLGGDAVHEALLDVRGRLDLAESLKIEARKVRRQFRDIAAQRREEADENFDKLLVKQGEGALRQEWQGGREREAKARTLNLDERRAARTAEKAARRAEEMFETITDMFFGLLNIREELIARLRELQFETVMER
jgi:hypothetical protein